MVFSTNQNRQLYVAAGVGTSLAAIKGAANLGKVYVGTDANGCKFINQNGHGGIVISDLINPDTIMWANATGPKDTEIKLKAFTLTLKDDPVSGQDYIVRVNFRQMYGMSDEDIYQKYGAVHAVKNMTKVQFYEEMAYSLVKNFNRLYAPLIDINVGGKVVARASKINGTVKLYDETGAAITATTTGITFQEKSQVPEWALGTKQYTPVYFEVIPTTILDSDGNEVVWGKVDTATDALTPTAVGNGYKYADLEYFCMGERGDQYRNVGWPNSIQTKYFVDPTKTYYCLDIHYAYQGTCEDIQKSEKTLTVIAEAKATIDSIITSMGIKDRVTYTDMYDGNKDNKIVAGKTTTEIIAGKADKA